MNYNKCIGGYFELEAGQGSLPYQNAYPVNFGRAGLELIIRARQYKHLYVPEYICPVVLNKLAGLGIAMTSYAVDNNLEMKGSTPCLSRDDGFLYVNYFGVKNRYCLELENKMQNLILDLTQAFFFSPSPHVDAFNSARKFVGVPDGGFVFGDFAKSLNLPQATSWQYCEHLLRRLDDDVAGGFEAFKENGKVKESWPPLRMSALTERLLGMIDMEKVKQKRIRNFQRLHDLLGATNDFVVDGLPSSVPLCYPYLARDGEALKRKLIAHQIFIPTYWHDIEQCFRLSDVAKAFQKELVCLPLDQRYDIADMDHIVDVLRHGDVK